MEDLNSKLVLEPFEMYSIDTSKIKTVKHIVRILDAINLKVTKDSDAYEKLKDLLKKDE